MSAADGHNDQTWAARNSSRSKKRQSQRQSAAILVDPDNIVPNKVNSAAMEFDQEPVSPMTDEGLGIMLDNFANYAQTHDPSETQTMDHNSVAADKTSQEL